jgi:hypothetical protein
MQKIIATILQLLLETTDCCNFKALSLGSITAVSSSSGKQNVQHVSSENGCCNHQAPLFGSAQQNSSPCSLLLILPVQNSLVQVAR